MTLLACYAKFKTCKLFYKPLKTPSNLSTYRNLNDDQSLQSLTSLLRSTSNHLKTIVRKHAYFRYKYTPEVEALVNKQIQAEQQAAQDYLNMAVVFLHPAVSRPGAGGFFMRMYEEELGHMQDFIQYQLLRGGMPVINNITAPNPQNHLTLLDAFTTALEMEKTVTGLLEKLVLAAESVKDYQCADFVTSVFLAEQMRSVNEMSHHVSKLCRLEDEHSLYHYDIQLGKTYPFTFKAKPG